MVAAIGLGIWTGGQTALGGFTVGAAGGSGTGLVSTGSVKGGLHGALSSGLFGAAARLAALARLRQTARGATWLAQRQAASAPGGGKCGSGAVSAVFGKFTN